ncbi:MAG: hypothetical protein E7441_05560 [Ruminococcaceae bacterium]|nr:hypothetical protein [Oscillospiraceae bacterium]
MDILTQIKPVPQKAIQGKGKVIIGKSGNPDFYIIPDNCTGELSQNALAHLKKKLLASIGGSMNTEARTVIKANITPDVPVEIIKNSNQSYSIEAHNDEIVISAYSDAGLYYGVITLLQCISVENNTFFVPEMSVLDWPDLRTRGYFMECRFGSNLMTLDDWKDVVDDMVEMKLNQLVVALYGCWNIQYDGVISEYVYIPVKKYPKLRSNVIKRYYSPQKREWVDETVFTPMAENDFFGTLVAYGKERGVEVLPLWNSYGHNTLIPRMYLEVSARIDGKPSGHGLCVSCKETYDMLFSIYDQIIDEYLAPNEITSFHIGMDEVRDEIATDTSDIYKVYSPWCECDECKKLSNDEKFLNHAIKLISYLKSRGMKSIYIYSDMMTKIVEPASFKTLLEEHDLLDVTVIDWWSYANNKEGLMFDTMHPELGIRSTIKPWNSYAHWSMTFDTVPNVYNLSEMAHSEGHVEGLLSYSAWDKSCDRNHMSMADYSWNFEGTGSIEEFRNRYAMREFGADYEAARHALRLIDEITAEENSYTKYGDLKENLESVGNGTLLQNDLAYYYFVYVRAGKDYPRNFPGETMEKLLKNTEMYAKQLSEIAVMSKEALDIFERLSANTDVNTHLAKRFACEVNNYLCLAEDYLALLKIHEVVNASDMSKKRELIAEISEKRKKERLSLMARIETIKEDFLIPSHLRNQSIFMQFFADIEAYANNTSDEDFNLDVKDLRKTASTAFWNLR